MTWHISSGVRGCRNEGGDVNMPVLESPPSDVTPEQWRGFLLRLREAKLMELRVIEDMLGMEYSVPTKRSKQ